jgi:hypothetical protein
VNEEQPRLDGGRGLSFRATIRLSTRSGHLRTSAPRCRTLEAAIAIQDVVFPVCNSRFSIVHSSFS